MTAGTPGHGARDDWREVAVRRLLDITNAALRYRWLLVVPPVLAAVFSLYSSRGASFTYTTHARFMTQGVRAQTSSGVASQLGINLGSAPVDATQNPDFYVELLTSRSLLEEVARAKYVVPSAGGPGREQTLEELYGGMDAAVGVLAGSIGTSIAPKTGIVSVNVTARSPELALQMAQQILRGLDSFNRQRRQSRVAAERKFTQNRMSEADSELRVAEQSLMDFYSRNRGFDRSPELRFQEQRLAREAARRQQLYASLAQAFEQAKIDEIRDTPVITVFEDPRLPTVPGPRHRLAGALNAAILAFIGSIALVLLLIFRQGWSPPSTGALEEFRTLRGEALFDLLHPLRAIRRLWS